MNQIDLNHRHAVVTGGAQGLGFSVAARLLESGASVSLWDRDAFLPKLAFDVSHADGVAAAMENTISKRDRIDILVASAGIAGLNFKSWEYPLDAWKQVIDINLTGVFLCCRAIVPHMLGQNHGSIVNISSKAGKEGNPTASGYSASKAGVIAFTKSLRKETALGNISVNCNTPAAAKHRFSIKSPSNTSTSCCRRFLVGASSRSKK